MPVVPILNAGAVLRTALAVNPLSACLVDKTLTSPFDLLVLVQLLLFLLAHQTLSKEECASVTISTIHGETMSCLGPAFSVCPSTIADGESEGFESLTGPQGLHGDF